MKLANELKPPIDEAIVHYGVKGMKWGVRRQRRLDQIKRVGAGKGSRVDRAKVRAFELSPNNIAINGLRGAAKNKAANMEARKARIQNGQATVKDLLNHIGGDRVFDKSHKNNPVRRS